ncbi:MAG: TlpA family protein disulfide reductase [Clostridiales bacterium]|nr:TlpA family protein disulfide reductase [Clostridiales bacterium]
MKPIGRYVIIVIATAVFALGAILCGCGGNSEAISASSDEKGDVSNMSMPAEAGVCDFMENFKTLDIYGNEVSSDIFSDYKITVVDVWGTYCGPCIKAMPTLQQVYEKYRDKGVNVIGLLCDAQKSDGSPDPDKILLAKEIMDSCGADFNSILLSDNIIYSVMQDITAIPTSFFVDSEGRIVGKMHVGGRSMKDWSGAIDEIL